MEFQLKDLINTRNNDIVGHLFLHCIDKDFATKHKFISEEDFQTKMIDIKLLINGQEFDIRKWLEQFRENYFFYIKREAQRIVSNKLSNRCDEITEQLNTLKEKLEEIESNIDWNEILVKQ